MFPPVIIRIQDTAGQEPMPIRLRFRTILSRSISAGLTHMTRTTLELTATTAQQQGAQYTEVLSRMPLITLEKIGESEPVPLKRDAKSPLEGIRALGLGHVIAGAAIGRDLAYHGADVLNIWRPNDVEIEAFAWDVQVGMRSTLLDGSKEDRATFDRLLKNADVFFSNRRPGYLERYGLTAEELSQKKPGLIHTA